MCMLLELYLYSSDSWVLFLDFFFIHMLSNSVFLASAPESAVGLQINYVFISLKMEAMISAFFLQRQA